MINANKANRQVCDVTILDLRTMKLFLDFLTANTTTSGLSGDNEYAMAKGSRRITFNNPLEGTMSIEAQVIPFRFYSLYSDGKIDTTASYAETQTIECGEAGKLTLTFPTSATIVPGTVFAFPADSAGDEDTVIAGTYSSDEKSFTATSASDIAVGTKYTVGYVVARSGVRKIAFNNKKTPRDYFITMSTVDKDEEGLLTPFKITAYKATIQRNFELSFSSEGAPATITATFDLMEDKDGNVLDIIEITEDAE